MDSTPRQDIERAAIGITGQALTVAQICALVADSRCTVDLGESVAAVARGAHDFLNSQLTSKVIYGVNTGFGPMSSHLIGKEELTQLQYNLIYSHAVGMGAALPHSYVLAAMVVRLNTLARGHSGVSLALLEQLRGAINQRIIPNVPEHGAVGTSGDLVQLAHVALGLIGQGQVWFRGDPRVPAAQALAAVGMSPYALKPKEGLSLINGTSFMSGIAALMCADAERLIALSTRSGAWALELVSAFDDGISQRLHELRPHAGQIAVASALRELTHTSKLMRRRSELHAKHRISDGSRQIDEDVQEIYSFRCIPQILGPMLDCLQQAQGIVETEINSVTDNPIVDVEHEQFWHGGHFHGEYVAMACDQLRASLAKLCMLTERRLQFFLNHRINRRLPPFLNMGTPGLTLALQGLQFVATSTTAHSQTLAFPHRVHSIATNADNQDVVSMGCDSALLTMKVIENAYIVSAIELLALAQATDLLDCKPQLSHGAQALHASIREKVPAIGQDRVLGQDLEALVELARTSTELPIRWSS